jgi:pimeloyl-ACP methyl ester carboxylesterase
VFSSTWAGVRLPEVLRILDEREPTLHEQQRLWRDRTQGSFIPGLGKRMAEEQPAIHWLAEGIAATNRGAGSRVWERDEKGNFDQVLMPETTEAELHGWRIPTLFLTGDEDVLVPSAAVALIAQSMGANLEVVEQVGHSVFLERAAVFNEVVLSFLSEHFEDVR